MPSEQLVSVWADTKGLGACRACGATLSWYTTTAAGRPMPFDADPVPRRSEHSPEQRLILHLSADDTHWRTCPDAAAFRRSKRGAV